MALCRGVHRTPIQPPPHLIALAHVLHGLVTGGGRTTDGRAGAGRQEQREWAGAGRSKRGCTAAGHAGVCLGPVMNIDSTFRAVTASPASQESGFNEKLIFFSSPSKRLVRRLNSLSYPRRQ